MLQKAEVKIHLSGNKKMRKFKGFEFPRKLMYGGGWQEKGLFNPELEGDG